MKFGLTNITVYFTIVNKFQVQGEVIFAAGCGRNSKDTKRNLLLALFHVKNVTTIFTYV